MSEFFNITVNKDVTLDDSITSSSSGWSSQKIVNEITSHRITRFEELDDVNVVNKEDKQFVAYSADTKKFITIPLSNLGTESGLKLKQISKMGVVGSPTNPQIIDIPISTIDFNVPKVNILKFRLGDQDIIKIENNFNNSESTGFIADEMIAFDGAAHLKTNFQYPLTAEEDVENNNSYSVALDKSKFKSISSLEVSGDTLTVTAIPHDRLLISNVDLNLSNVANIDYFNLSSSPGVKIICSVDSGSTWKTFNTDKWESVNLTVDDVSTKGIDVTTFNSITSAYWNLLITANKVRFAYLLQDSNSIDELKMRYDGQGSWIETKNTEYDVIYASNNLLQVKLYFNGDIKINY